MVTAPLLSSQEPSILSVTSSLVSLDVIVRDPTGSPVMDLKRDDFQIFEDGVLQKSSLFELAEIPRSTMLIFDRSGSAEKQEKFVLDAINVFMRTIRPIDRIAIFSFSRELEIRMNWRSVDKAQLPKVSMGAIQPWSGIYATLESAGRRFGRETGRRGIIMLTDGNDSDFLNQTKALGGVLDVEKDRDFKGYLNKLARQNIPIYFVALPPDPHAEYADLRGADYRNSREYLRSGLRSPTIAEDYIERSRLRMVQIAQLTAGQVLLPTRMEDVAQYYDQIARRLGMSYTLGYSPTNGVAGGKYRSIEVRVRPGFTVAQSRTGYQP